MVLVALMTWSGRARAEAPSRAEPHATVLLVVGAAGTPEYGGRFAETAARWQKVAARAGAATTVLGLEPAARNTTDRQRLQQAVAEAVRGDPQAPLWLVFIGHGTWDGRHGRFNLRGPDVTAAELGDWCKPLGRPLIFVNGASASAPFLRALTGPGRIVVTATKTGAEISAPRFGPAFAEAIGDARADLDRDGGVSVLEAFLHASKRVEAGFAEQGLLASEHALLEDNGDGLGTSAAFFKGMSPSTSTSTTTTTSASGDIARDGARARQVTLVPAPAEQALPPAARRRRDELETAVLALREQRPKLPEATYFARLERLMLQLARIYTSNPDSPAARSPSPHR